ncbi:MAG: type II toxin-antitoxin system RelE/ParE family toxin [Patescibacteria group bacterium]
MFSIIVTEEFEKRFSDLPTRIQKKLIKQEKFLRENPLHPSLHTEKLQPKIKEYWSFRIDKSYRVLFRFTEKDELILITVGTHDWVYRMKN